MLQQEREKLWNRESEYLSIGITQGGRPRGSIAVPWIRTGHAFNMRTPNVYLSPQDLLDEEIMAKVCQFRVIGCYIWVPLTDYSFIRRFAALEDLYILRGENIRDLEFLEGLLECDMIFLQDAQLQNLEKIVQLHQQGQGIFHGPRCLCLEGCRVEDMSALLQEGVWFSELLIACPKGSNEQERWEAVDAIDRSYVEYEV